MAIINRRKIIKESLMARAAAAEQTANTATDNK
jgi:hypothetical protein